MKTPLQYLKDEGLFGWNYWHLIKNPHKLFIEIYYHIKWFIQRGRRGWADCDAWSLDHYLASWMPEAVLRLTKGSGFPVNLYMQMYPLADPFGQNWSNENCKRAHEEWVTIITKIAKGFAAGRKIQELDFDYQKPEEMKALQDALNEGLDLFNKYYLNLWN